MKGKANVLRDAKEASVLLNVDIQCDNYCVVNGKLVYPAIPTMIVFR